MQTTADSDPTHHTAPRPSVGGGSRSWATTRPLLVFLVAWGFLNAVLNVRYPASEPKFWWLIPSVDVLAVFGLFALLARRGRRLPGWAHAALVVAFVAIRLLRVGDGIKYRYFNRPFNLYLDLPLVPELGRLLNDTLSPLALGLSLIGLVVGLGLVGLGVRYALRTAEDALARPLPLAMVAAVVLAFLAYSPFFRPPVRYEHRFVGAFAASGAVRWFEELKFLLEVSGFKSAKVAEIEGVQRELAARPVDLTKLAGADVYVFLIESYGETVLNRRDFSGQIAEVFAGYERDLGARGFTFASSVLNSPTYGGGSWLAHATIATGVRVENQMHYNLLETKRPVTMAELFRRAGYRTVRAEPGTTREGAHAAFAGFDERYSAPEFDYRGPRFGWAPMPDQYVVDFVRRHELAVTRKKPLFIEYVLVSSHAPWSALPALVPSFGQIGDGALYHGLTTVRYPANWSDLELAATAYVRSVCYDFEVLKRYVAEYVEDGALILVLGDHQPAVEVALDRQAHGVPIHVMSKNSGFIAAFREHGYDLGMRPGSARGRERAGLETLLKTLVFRFSSEGARGQQ